MYMTYNIHIWTLRIFLPQPADAPCNHNSVEKARASAVSCNPRAECDEVYL